MLLKDNISVKQITKVLFQGEKDKNFQLFFFSAEKGPSEVADKPTTKKESHKKPNHYKAQKSIESRRKIYTFCTYFYTYGRLIYILSFFLKLNRKKKTFETCESFDMLM